MLFPWKCAKNRLFIVCVFLGSSYFTYSLFSEHEVLPDVKSLYSRRVKGVTHHTPSSFSSWFFTRFTPQVLFLSRLLGMQSGERYRLESSLKQKHTSRENKILTKEETLMICRRKWKLIQTFIVWTLPFIFLWSPKEWLEFVKTEDFKGIEGRNSPDPWRCSQ